jgi:hypothetical protein
MVCSLNHEVFLITDNSVFEEAYYKGQSPSRELTDIVFGSTRHSKMGGLSYTLSISPVNV